MKKMIWAFCLSLFSVVALADDPTGAGANAAVERQANQILAELSANQALYQSNPAAFEQFIERDIAPNLDFNKMAEIALGKHLNEVKSAGKLPEFTSAFRKLLIRVYSKGWTNYTHAKITVMGTPTVDKYNRAQVRAQVVSNSGQRSSMNFALYYTGGKWKLYDATFENVSLMTSYRNTFDTELNNGSIDALISKMQTMN